MVCVFLNCYNVLCSSTWLDILFGFVLVLSARTMYLMCIDLKYIMNMHQYKDVSAYAIFNQHCVFFARVFHWFFCYKWLTWSHVSWAFSLEKLSLPKNKIVVVNNWPSWSISMEHKQTMFVDFYACNNMSVSSQTAC